MSDLDTRMHGVDWVPVPDLWHEARTRVPRNPEPPRGHAVGVAITAFVIAAASVTALVWVFRGNPVRPVGPLGPRPNGPIVTVERGQNSLPGVDNVDLVAIDPATGRRQPITSGPAADLQPVWSPDGSRVAFLRTSVEAAGGRLGTTTGVYVMNADGSDLKELYECHDRQVCEIREMTWSPNDRLMAWVAEVDRSTRPGTRRPGYVLSIIDTTTGSIDEVCDEHTCDQGMGFLQWSPDGTHLTFSNGALVYPGPGGSLPSSIWTVSSDAMDLTRLTEGIRCVDLEDACFSDSRPGWSPDGTRLAFLRTPSGLRSENNSTLILMSADGSRLEQVPVCDNVSYCSPSAPRWSPDGTGIVTSVGYDPRRIVVVDPGAATSTSVSVNGSACQDPNEPSWSPDGRSIVFLGGPGRIPNVCTVSRDGGEGRVLVEGLDTYRFASGPGFSWLPAGTIDMSRAEAAPSSSQIPLGVLPEGTLVFASVNGRVEEDLSQLWVLHSGDSTPRQITFGKHSSASPDLSPDGTRIAFRTGVRSSIWVAGADGSNTSQLTPEPPQESTPAWSPDGQRIAYTVSGTARWTGGVYVMNADGSRPRIVAEGNAINPTWRPDGKAITFALNTPDGQLHLRTVELATGQIHEVIDLPGSQDDARWSPDGTRLAFSWSNYPSTGLYVVDADGTHLRRVVAEPFGSGIAWSPDGAWLAFGGVDDRLGPQIYVVRPDGSALRRVTDMEGFVRNSLVFSNTGEPTWGP